MSIEAKRQQVQWMSFCMPGWFVEEFILSFSGNIIVFPIFCWGADNTCLCRNVSSLDRHRINWIVVTTCSFATHPNTNVQCHLIFLLPSFIIYQGPFFCFFFAKARWAGGDPVGRS